MLTRAVALIAGMVVSISANAQTSPAPLMLEAKIPLGQVNGRIDHLAVDLKRQRLFVAELGNDSLGIVDLAAQKVLRTITGLSEPQGVGYEPITDTIYVANASDGSVRVLRGEDFSAVGRIDLDDDADNIRIDEARKRVLVGYGKGAIAVIEPATRAKVADIRLKAHPEGFQIDGDRVFVNVPDARLIEAIDLGKGEAGTAWPTQPNQPNFPMAIDLEAHRLLVVFRSPARLLVMSTRTGAFSQASMCVVTQTTYLSMRNAIVFTSVAGPVSSMCSSNSLAAISGLVRCRLCLEHEHRCSWPRWIGCSLRCVQPEASPPLSGYFVRYRDRPSRTFAVPCRRRWSGRQRISRWRGLDRPVSGSTNQSPDRGCQIDIK
jgi:hypothetical protein